MPSQRENKARAVYRVHDAATQLGLPYSSFEAIDDDELAADAYLAEEGRGPKARANLAIIIIDEEAFRGSISEVFAKMRRRVSRCINEGCEAVLIMPAAGNQLGPGWKPEFEGTTTIPVVVCEKDGVTSVTDGVRRATIRSN